MHACDASLLFVSNTTQLLDIVGPLYIKKSTNLYKAWLDLLSLIDFIHRLLYITNYVQVPCHSITHNYHIKSSFLPMSWNSIICIIGHFYYW